MADTPDSPKPFASARLVNQIRRETPPSSAPADTNFPDTYHSSEIVGRQINSTPIPTRRYLRENNIPTPVLAQASISVPQLTYSNVDQTNNEDYSKPDCIIVGNGKLNPTRTGIYGNVGEVEIVEGRAIHRVASFAGVIETAESAPSIVEQQEDLRSASTSPRREDASINNQLLPSIAYSPSVYGGVWENDPHVVSFGACCTSLRTVRTDRGSGSYSSSIQPHAASVPWRPKTNAGTASELSSSNTFEPLYFSWSSQPLKGLPTLCPFL